MMKVILKEDVPNLGVVGDLVSVRDGYGRNYLIPQGKAVFASVRSVGELAHQKRLAAHRRQQATAQANHDRSNIEKLMVVMSAKVAPPQLNDDGELVAEQLQRLFGTITNRDIAKVLRDSGVKVDHRRVTLVETIRTVGKFLAKVRLDGGVEAKLPFWVIPEGAADVESEKKRVEAAQESAKKAIEEAAAREAAEAVAASAAMAAEEREPEEHEDEEA
jgi:large subunit ribosomal protein L9